MIFPTHVKVGKGFIDAAPMVDVVFLLLIFFILSSPFVLQPGIKVVLPPSDVKTPGAFQGLVVTVTRSDMLFFNEQRTSMAGLQKSLQAVAKQGTAPQELVIKADKQVSHGTVVQIMSLAMQAGISSINIATRPEALPTETPPPVTP